MNTLEEKTIFGYPESELELIDNKWYTKEDGEFVADAIPESWTIKDDEGLEWAMEKIFDAESELLAIDAQYQAVLARYEAAKKRKQAQVDWRRGFFGPHIENYAKGKLDGKTKYIETPFGRCQWRIKKGGLRVDDAEAALNTAKSFRWDEAIKVTESFQISKLTPEQKELAIGCQGFTLEPDSETFDIKTGIGK